MPVCSFDHFIFFYHFLGIPQSCFTSGESPPYCIQSDKLKAIAICHYSRVDSRAFDLFEFDAVCIAKKLHEYFSTAKKITFPFISICPLRMGWVIEKQSVHLRPIWMLCVYLSFESENQWNMHWIRWSRWGGLSNWRSFVVFCV